MGYLKQLTDIEISELSEYLIKLLPKSSSLLNVTKLYLDGIFKEIIPTHFFAYDGIIQGECAFVVAKQEKKYYNSYSWVMHTPQLEYFADEMFSLLEDMVDWTKHNCFTAVHIEICSKICDIIRKHGRLYAGEICTVYYMDNKHARNCDFQPNATKIVKNLRIEDADKVVKHWKFAEDGTLGEMRDCIEHVGSAGIFIDNNEMVSWAFASADGAINALFTTENHRGKGYGKIVLKKLAADLAMRGHYPTTHVEAGNEASVKLMASTGFLFSHLMKWVEFTPIKGTVE